MNRQTGKIMFAAAGMLVLVLDPRTALLGANQGIELCIKTLLPSLFPYLFLSGLLVGGLLGHRIHLLDPICRFCRIPSGSEGILLVGLLGGYPTGANCIGEGFRLGQLTKNQAQRLLGFCNNAGPAFLFGISASLFSDRRLPWILWGLHIVSALLTARILPEGPMTPTQLTGRRTGYSQALLRAVRVMGIVCGWVILFRILLAFCTRWFLWLLPMPWQIFFTGILELSNGCCSLSFLPSEPLRFLLLSGFLAFGGVCVMMQTSSAADGLSLKWFYLGKLLQTALSLSMSLALLPWVFPGYLENKLLWYTPLGVLLILGFGLIKSKNNSSISCKAGI